MTNTLPPLRTLTAGNAVLRPMEENDYDAFLSLAQDDDTWQFFTLNLADAHSLQTWMQAAFTEVKEGKRIAFTIIDKNSGEIAGSTSLGNISLYDLRAEIGWSWLGSIYRSSGINFLAKYALLKFSFEELNLERVEFKTDVLNTRARKGLEKIGGKEEGIFRSHMTMWNNRRRDSVYYSVIKKEWNFLKTTIFKELEGQ